jgi:hypothetical protein
MRAFARTIRGEQVLRSRHGKVLLAAMSVCTLVAVAACGGDDDDNVAAPGPGATATTAGATGTTTGGTTGGTTAGTGGTTAGTGGTSGGEAPVNSGAEQNAGKPVQGGTLVYGLEADSANAWAPYRVSCATSCFIPLESVSDPLFTITNDGQTVPLLLKSVDHNADYTQWTFHVRDGIKFHDGTPLDGAAVKFNIDTCRFAPLTATAYLPIDKTEASGQDVVLTLKGGPWVALPAYFSLGQCGYMFSPQWLGSLPDVPQRRRAGRPTTRRWRRRRRTATRPSRSGSAPSSSSRTRRATATRSRPCATPTTGAAPMGSPVRTCPTSTPSRRSSPSTSTAGRTPSSRASST